jgi:putative membrane protein
MTTRRRWLIGISGALLALFGYEVVRSWIYDLVRLPGIPGGLTTLTAIMALFSLTHAWHSVGGRLTAAFFALSAVIAWALEEFGVVTGLLYGGYHYTSYLGARLGEVPVLIPLAWFMMIYPSYVIANLVVARRPAGTPAGLAPLVGLAAASAVVMTVWDLVIDPILSGPDVRAWVWGSGGAYFGVPVQNYFGWFVTTFVVYLAYRALEQRFGDLPAGPIDWRVAAMPVAAYGLMLFGDLASGVTPPELFVIGPIVMGVPLILGGWRVAGLRRGSAGSADRHQPTQDGGCTEPQRRDHRECEISAPGQLHRSRRCLEPEPGDAVGGESAFRLTGRASERSPRRPDSSPAAGPRGRGGRPAADSAIQRRPTPLLMMYRRSSGASHARLSPIGSAPRPISARAARRGASLVEDVSPIRRPFASSSQ